MEDVNRIKLWIKRLSFLLTLRKSPVDLSAGTRKKT